MSTLITLFLRLLRLSLLNILAAVFNVPMEKRGKLIGAGGHRIKAIAEETETVVESVDEENMSIFAPSQEAMEEAKERVDAILNEAEMKVGLSIIYICLENLTIVGILYNVVFACLVIKMFLP